MTLLPKVSVLMSCYNESINYLKLSIESILTQTYKNFEFIIILDNPNNNELENKIKEYKKKDKRIIFIKNKKNLGLAQSLNEGIKISKGKYIARHDADDISKKNRLKIQYEYMEKNKNIDLLFGWVKYIDEKSSFIRDFKPKKYKVKNLKKYFFKEHLLVHPSLFSKSKILKDNLYDRKQIRSQDFDLWIRLISKNYNFDLIEKIILDYRIFNEKNYEKRIKKVKDSYNYGFMSLNNNFLKIININFGLFLFFKFLIFNFILILFSIKFIKVLVLIKDRFK